MHEGPGRYAGSLVVFRPLRDRGRELRGATEWNSSRDGAVRVPGSSRARTDRCPPQRMPASDRHHAAAVRLSVVHPRVGRGVRAQHSSDRESPNKGSFSVFAKRGIPGAGKRQIPGPCRAEAPRSTISPGPREHVTPRRDRPPVRRTLRPPGCRPDTHLAICHPPVPQRRPG